MTEVELGSQEGELQLHEDIFKAVCRIFLKPTVPLNLIQGPLNVETEIYFKRPWIRVQATSILKCSF